MRRIFDFLFGGRSAMWTAIFTGVLTVFTWKMYEVSKATSETSRASERAFLSFSGPALAARNNDLQTGQWASYQLSLNWTNSGSTPATTAVIQANGQIWPTDLPDGFAFPLLPERTRAVFGPKATYGTSINVPSVDWIQSWHGAGRLFVWGTVVYRDAFPRDPERLSEFCAEIHHIVIGPIQPPAAGAAAPALTIENPNAQIVGFQWQACRQHNCYDNDCRDYTERVADARQEMR